jgi:multidrug transporter EmrE-like cation transporter
VVFPVNNVAIIALSAAFAVWFFRERLNSANWWGLALAVAAIGLIALTR